MDSRVKKSILIADDEPRMRILISDFLENEGYGVIEANDGLEAVDKFLKDPGIHLVILDIMMPGLDGFEVCKRIREISKVPILMATAKNSEEDELTGFRKGTDEFIRKPFSPSVLVARVNALIKRTYGDDQEIITKGDLTINPEELKVTYKDIDIDLSQTEYKLLYYMVENEDNILSREKLLNYVWGYDYDGTERTVDTHMNRLRMKLGDCGDYIKTIRGFGYKFEVER